MKRIVYLLFVGVLSLSLSYCSGDDGDMGPQGPKGEQGIQGEKGDKGDKGSKGADGSTVLSGTKNPKDSEGENGDFYINTASYIIFGPKKSGKWGSGSSLLGSKGAKGDKGDKGSKGDKGNKGDKGETEYELLSGSETPAVSLGEIGDFYVDTKNKILYFKTGASNLSTWSKVANLANTIQFTKEGVDFTTSSPRIKFNINLSYDVIVKSAVNIYVETKDNFGDDRSTEMIPFEAIFSDDPSRNFGVVRTFYEQDGNDTEFTLLKSGNFPNNPYWKHATVRIVVTEADVFETVSKKIDFNNYEEVSTYFNLD